MKNTLTALALLAAVTLPTMGNANCGPVCPAPAPTCAPCAPACATVCTQPVTTCTICCPKIQGFWSGGNRSGSWGVSCNPCCN